MEEERPVREAREALERQSKQREAESEPIAETTTEQEQTVSGTWTTKQTRLVVGGIVLVVMLIIVGLLLPPISLGERIGLFEGEATVPAQVEEARSGEPVVGDDFALALTSSAGDVKVNTLAQGAFLNDQAGEEWTTAMASIPAGRQLAGNVYSVSYGDEIPQGSAQITIPAGVESRTLDLFGWDGQSWTFFASQVSSDGGQLTSIAGPLPRAFALMRTAAPVRLEITAEVLPAENLPVDVLPLISEISAGTLTLAQDGSVTGEVASIPTGGYRQLVRVTNVGLNDIGAVVDSASLAALLGNPATQQRNIQGMVNQARSAGFLGVNLDYRGVNVSQRQAFSAFVNDLAVALHGQALTLAVTLESPAFSGDQWETAGYDWPALGQAADIIYAQLPLNPTLYSDNGQVDRLVAWATRQIDRQLLSLVVNLSAVEATGGLSAAVKNAMALDNFGELGFVSGAAEVNPNTAVEVALLGSAGPLEWDSESLTYGYTYEQDGQSHQVWLGSEAVLAFQSRFALYYHVRGIAVSGLAGIADAEGYANAIKSLVEATAGPQPASAAIVWAVEDESGAVVASSTGDTLAYAWQAPEQPGRYTIRADFAQGETIASLGTLDVLVQTPVAPTPEPTVAPVVEATATPVSEVVDTVNLGGADAVSEYNSNVRSGPGQAYGVINGALKGTKVSLIGRNENSSWLQVTLADGTEGWIFADLLTISSSISIGSLAVVEVEPPPSIVTDGGTTPPPVIAPAGGGSFELGGQAFGAPYGQMQYAGMTWIKRQHKWSAGHTSQNVAGMITEAHNAGFKILLSIPGADHGSIDFQAYAAFLGQVASLPDPPDAIEVWNEMNIDVEWPTGQISPSSYVQNMLIPASNAIKSANPNIMVISGAPAPTGFYGGGCGGGGCDDAPYMAGMAAAGAASYIDCIGIHYNEGILPPSQTSGDPRGSSGHYTRYFWGMINTYYNAFGGSRPLCFTELGYLTPEGYGGLPGGFAWAVNVTVAQQAQWLAEATSLSANSGKVRMLIVWNVDSTTYGGHDPQAGYAIIRPGGSCLACDFLSQVMGR